MSAQEVLIDRLLDMFPEADADFIIARAEHLVGQSEAIANFIDELMKDSRQGAGAGGAEAGADGAEAGASGAEAGAGAEAWSCGAEAGAGGAEAWAGAVMIEDQQWWETRKLADMCYLFPEFSPDWVNETFQGILQQVRQEATSMDVVNTDQIFMNQLEKILFMDQETRKKIPTYQEWERKQKEEEEELKWTEKITPRDMIEQYSGDPGLYFYDLKRAPPADVTYRHSWAQKIVAGSFLPNFRFFTINLSSRYGRYGITLLKSFQSLLIVPIGLK